MAAPRPNQGAKKLRHRRLIYWQRFFLFGAILLEEERKLSTAIPRSQDGVATLLACGDKEFQRSARLRRPVFDSVVGGY